MSLDLRNLFLTFFEEKEHLRYPSASLKSDDPGLLFNVAGMQQFKPYFQGATPNFPGYGTWHRVATSQKCMRAGGKDSDIENVGRTRRHHTFFEMLGNFSFGDYFKREAITWAWEFLTDEKWLGLDPERLYVTVFTDDDEAYDIWANEVGIPKERISRWGEAENFWPANAIKDDRQGPCGPCSEIFYDRGPDYGSPDETGPNTGSGDRFVEIWNLVFTQFNLQDGELTPLPQTNIDTGMGLERTTAVVTGARDAYSTELFLPIIRRIEELSGVPYRDVESVEHRIIADHTRSITFAIADGIPPANDGAGYVIKMLIRRASRQAFLLGVREPILFDLSGAVVEAMGAAYPELVQARDRIAMTIRAEEEQFLRTLESGIERVRSLLDELDGEVLPGEVAFDLWQTYGFPLDLTREMAAERGVLVDDSGYAAAREEARAQSRAAQAGGDVFAGVFTAADQIARESGETRFTGYDSSQGEAQVVGLIAGKETVSALSEGQSGDVALDATPFYAEGGGQVGDSGKLEWPGGCALVSDTQRVGGGVILHRVRVVRGELRPGDRVTARVDPGREETRKHHTATHLLHAALRSTLGGHVTQAGSLVAPDRLRFDFSHPTALTGEELQAVENLVNRWIQANFPVSWQVVPIEEARERGAMMLFGEKYGNEVRMVSVGEAAAGEPGPGAHDSREAASEAVVSVELCGGTHVRHTGEIGAFVIVAQESVSAGIRRIEAVVGRAALQEFQSQRQMVGELAQELGVSPANLTQRVARLQGDLKEAQRETAKLRDRLAAAQASGGAGSAQEGKAAGFTFAVSSLEGLDAASIRTAADNLLQRSGANLAVVGSDGLLVVKAGEAARERGAHAGNIIRALAQRAGGKGGGRPDMAQAGIKDPARLGDAMDSVAQVLTELYGD